MTTDRHRSGSVLMETVLVLPLLVMLFGGLFVLGDILHGRLHLLTVDRAVAWSSSSRFEGGRTNLVSSWFVHLGPHTAFTVEKAVARRHEGEDDDNDWLAWASPFRERGGDGKTLGSTEWLDFVSGHAEGRVDVPMWAAMVNTHAVVNRRPQGEYLASDWRLLAKENGDYRDDGRVYVVRRAPDVAKRFDRTRGAADLAWFAIPLDRWPGGRAGPRAPDVSIQLKPFTRHSAALAVGE